MAYRGPITESVRTYRDAYTPGLGSVRTASGWQERTLERYACEQCGHECRVLGQATEPFYCPKCSRLIQID